MAVVWTSVGLIYVSCVKLPSYVHKCLFSTVNFSYNKVFSISDVKGKHFCKVSLFERENVGFKFAMLSA